MRDLDYDVVIGPPCARALKVLGTMSNIYYKPVLAWGFVNEAVFSDMDKYPYVASVQPNSETCVVGSQSISIFNFFFPIP